MTKQELKDKINNIIDVFLNDLSAARDHEFSYENMTVKEMREYLGLSKVQFCKKYDIPIRTLISWEKEERSPAPYVLKLLERAIKQDKNF